MLNYRCKIRNKFLGMKKLVYVFLIIPVVSLGQGISIDFEDGDLTEWIQSDSGHWCITDIEAISGSYSLMHCFDSEVAASEWIAFFHQPVELNDNTSLWQFTIRYSNNPSSNNNWAVFLSHNALPDHEGKLSDGLIIGVNYSGNSDEIIIWKIQNGTSECLLNTGFNWELDMPATKEAEFTLTGAEGVFNLLIGIEEEDAQDLGSFLFEDLQAINAFILYYKYTATYDMRLWFDDLLIEADFIPDTTSPSVDFISFIDPQTIEIGFSEPVCIYNEANWCIDGIGCSQTPTAPASSFEINFVNPMVPGHTYQLESPDIVDIYGNEPVWDENSLDLYYPAVYDIVITEIMADPSPGVLLPEAEYIELYNKSNKEICLKNWSFTANSRKVTLPGITVSPGSYLLLCDIDNLLQFDLDLYKAGLGNFPALTNSGAGLILQDRSGKLIHAVTYDDSWYTTTDKKEGGWSLEMINPWDACNGSDNWSESEDYRGGTPAAENSVYDVQTINPAPELWRAAVTDTGSLMLYFSEPLDSHTVSSVLYYSVDKSIGSPVQVLPAWPLTSRVELFFSEAFEPGTEYTINLTSDPSDCSGIRIEQPADLVFSVPEEADSSDIIINEILFDPAADQIEFIELFNTSDKTIDLKDYGLILSERNTTGKVITTDYWPLRPSEYCLIAGDYRGIDFPGKFEKAGKVIYMPDMPTLSNEGNNLFLQSKNERIIDVAAYSSEWHHEIVIETKGVSLERISHNGSGMVGSNWQSASSDAGYMTPAAPNSQYAGEISECNITLEPETITPNSDGRDDVMTICYELDNEGYMGRVLIFDINGKRCRILANGVLLGVSGCYIFDGRNEDGSVLPTGYYILFFEASHASGKQYIRKKAFVVTRE